jgi:hypothetical protein
MLREKACDHRQKQALLLAFLARQAVFARFDHRA